MDMKIDSKESFVKERMKTIDQVNKSKQPVSVAENGE
jgi:hypothetical protein